MYHIGSCHLCFQILHGPAVIPQRKPTGSFLVNIIDADDLNTQFLHGLAVLRCDTACTDHNRFKHLSLISPLSSRNRHTDQIDSYRENIICGFRLSSSVNGIKSPFSPISGESSTDIYPE